MKSALVTGSESFGRYVSNPTKWLALAVDGKQVAGYQVHSLVLPSVVRFSPDVDDAGTTIVKKAIEVNADIIVSLGMSSGVGGFCLERTAINWIYNQKYCSAQENSKPLDLSRPAKDKMEVDLSHLDFEKLGQLFKQAGLSLESAISDDAGQYSCNSWMYRTMLAMQKQSVEIPYVFMHMSCTEESIEFIHDFDRENKVLIDKQDALKALEIVLQVSTS